MDAKDFPAYSTLSGLKPADMVLLFDALNSHTGVVDDIDTLEKIEQLKTKISDLKSGTSSVYGM